MDVWIVWLEWRVNSASGWLLNPVKPTISIYIHYILLCLLYIYSMMKYDEIYDEIYDVCVWKRGCELRRRRCPIFGTILIQSGAWRLVEACTSSPMQQLSSHDAQLEAPIGSMFWWCSWLQLHQWCILMYILITYNIHIQSYTIHIYTYTYIYI